MDPNIVSLLRFSAVLTLALVMVLAGLKLAHRESIRWRGVRTAYYVSAVGELLSRQTMVSKPPRGWTEDPTFHRVLSDYTALVTGREAEFLGELTEATGVLTVLAKRSHLSEDGSHPFDSRRWHHWSTWPGRRRSQCSVISPETATVTSECMP